MRYDTGIIRVIEIDGSGEIAALIDCPHTPAPTPGKYLLAYNPQEPASVASQVLFPIGLTAGLSGNGTTLLGPVPPSWGPGTSLRLRGPIGNGFKFPQKLRRLALVAIGGPGYRLLPLIPMGLESGADVTIFTDSPPLPGSPMPPAVEINPLSALPENLPWANLLAIDIPTGMLSKLRQILGLEPHEKPACQVQALISTPMPCGGLAECGACAVPTRGKGYKLACKHGPVFDLNQLDW
jgi:dihydroorotate dehydrogenase electron transfer subunit